MKKENTTLLKRRYLPQVEMKLYTLEMAPDFGSVGENHVLSPN